MKGSMIKKKVVLSIDTSDREKTSVSLELGERIFKKEKQSEYNTSQTLLPLIDTLFQENNLTINEVTEIEVTEGPGSFTGLRVGVTIANTLGWILQIPVNGKKGNIVEPQYL